MKILVYGAGVLGSYLAHALHRGGNEVTLLARGKRLGELREKGLFIRHYLQRKTTHDTVGLTDTYGKHDAYDAVFVVMRRNQLDEVLPQLCENETAPLLVLVGNNVNASDTLQHIQAHSRVPKRVMFAFQTTGGRRENGEVISVHKGAGKLTAGSLDADPLSEQALRQAFAGTRFQLAFRNDMDVWLKSHAAFVLPIAFVCYRANGNLKIIARDKALLYRAIDAMDEAYQMLETCGFAPPAEDVEFVRQHRFKCYMMLKILASTPIGRLAASDHAMNAKDEMRRLYDDFCAFRNRENITTPAWDELAQYMPEA